MLGECFSFLVSDAAGFGLERAETNNYIRLVASAVPNSNRLRVDGLLIHNIFALEVQGCYEVQRKITENTNQACVPAASTLRSAAERAPKMPVPSLGQENAASEHCPNYPKPRQDTSINNDDTKKNSNTS